MLHRLKKDVLILLPTKSERILRVEVPDSESFLQEDCICCLVYYLLLELCCSY